MTNPVTVPVTEGSWVKVATGVTCAGIRILKQVPRYVWTYRDTTDPAPTLVTEGSPLRFPGESFSAGTAFDLYIWCTGGDGSIRLDEDFEAEYLIDA